MKPMTAYGVVHYLLRKTNGAASKHWCVGCGARAQQWAYDHSDVFERFDEHLDPPLIFSLNFEHYQPMCQPCHYRLDMANVKRLAERRVAA